MKKMSIIDYYKSLIQYRAKQNFRNKVMDRCDISYPSFQKKVRDDSWTKLEREAILVIIEEESTNEERA